jgi:hypothetical protein
MADFERRAFERLLPDGADLAGDGGPTEGGFGATAASHRKFAAQITVGEQAVEHSAKLSRIAFANEQSRIADGFGDRAGARTDYRRLARHRFDQDTAKLLFPVGPRERGKRKHVHGAQVVSDFARAD